MCRITNHQTRLPRATSSLALNACRDGASTASLGNLFQCVTTLFVKNFLLISNLNLPCLNFKPFPLVLSQLFPLLFMLCYLGICEFFSPWRPMSLEEQSSLLTPQAVMEVILSTRKEDESWYLDQISMLICFFQFMVSYSAIKDAHFTWCSQF